jgi:hypothetical protein
MGSRGYRFYCGPLKPYRTIHRQAIIWGKNWTAAAKAGECAAYKKEPANSRPLSLPRMHYRR